MTTKGNFSSFLKTNTGQFAISELLSEFSFFIHVYWVFFLSEFSLSSDKLVLIMSLSAIMPIFTIPIYGVMVQRRSDKNLGWWAGLYSILVNITFVVLFAGLLTHNFLLTLVGLFSSWFFNQFLSLEFNSIMLKLARKSENVRYSYTKLQQFTEFGYAFGILSAGIITSMAGIAYAVVFAIIFQALFAIRMFSLAKRYKIEDRASRAKNFNFNQLKSNISTYSIVVLTFILIGTMMVCAEDAFSSFELNKFNFGEAIFGVQNVLIMLVAILVLNFTQKKLSLEKGFIAGIGFSILMYLCIILLQDSTWFIIPSIIFTGFISNVYSSCIPLLDKYLDISEKTASMTYKMIRIVGQFLTYYMTFWIYTEFGRKVFIIVMGLYFIATVLMLSYVKRAKLKQGSLSGNVPSEAVIASDA